MSVAVLKDICESLSESCVTKRDPFGIAFNVEQGGGGGLLKPE